MSETEIEQLERLLRRSADLRPNYPASLGAADPEWRILLTELGNPIPLMHEILYSRLSGTPRTLGDQRLMDFVPGFRLIAVRELANEAATVRRMGFPTLLPFLANYSSDYVCAVLDERGAIVGLDHDGAGPQQMHASAAKFLETQLAFYARGIYSLDEKGYLDQDWDEAYRLAIAVNPGEPYWVD